MTTARQTLPTDTVNAFTTLNTEERDNYIRSLHAAGWTQQSIAVAVKLSRERVRQLVRLPGTATLANLPAPTPPARPVKEPRVFVEPDPDVLARMLELQPLAVQVRANSTKYRAEAEEYTRLISQEHQERGVALYRLGLRLNVSHGALRFRLARYGYKRPMSGGTSKVYAPIKKENRIGLAQ